MIIACQNIEEEYGKMSEEKPMIYSELLKNTPLEDRPILKNEDIRPMTTEEISKVAYIPRTSLRVVSWKELLEMKL